MFGLLTHRLVFVAGLVLAAVLLPFSGYSEEFGFKATLDNPPSMVSAYDAPSQDFSVANPPLVYPTLSPILDRRPKLIQSSFDGQYLVFGAEYHRGDSLIPVAASAEQYLKYRMAKYERNGFGMMGQRALAAAQGKQGPGGISIGVPLPTRLKGVFGEGGGNLRVSGYRRVSFSGRSQWRDGVVAEQVGQSKFPSLNMDQIYRFDIDGTIGSKISVHVSEDSQTDIPLANRLQLRYKGDDDDILKVIEAGNTNLSLPNTRFVGYSSQIRGLFGIKTEAQLGALKLTTIVSQEKGSSERASISSNGDSSATRIRDYDYAEGRVYDLFYANEQVTANDRIVDMHVYEARPNVRPEEELTGRKTKLVVNPDPAHVNDPGFREALPMWELDRDLYNFYDDSATNRHYIVFNSEHKYYALGVYIVLEKRDASGRVLGRDTVGNVSSSDSITLKMLMPSQSYVPAHPTWNLMWRNVYRIPQGVKPADLNIRILEAPVGSEGTSSALEDQRLGGTQSQGKYIRILGLDQYDRNGARRPDDMVDDRIEIFNSEWGLLIFPTREPFNSDTQYVDANGTKLPPLADKVPEIYQYTSPKERTDNSKYYIEYSSRTRSSLIRLNRANIIEGSERITVNGRTLTRGPDYSIQYDFGTVTLLSPDAMDPNAKVNIDFEYAPFLAIQKKSLFGARAEYSFSDDFRIGSTMLYKTDKAQDRKPRVGQETARMMVTDFDGTMKFYPQFLTKVINALPFLATDAPSALTVSGEVAQSRPNPNIDNVAYVDDFESALEQLTLPMSRGGWTMASHPVQSIAPNLDTARAKLLWHNPVGGVRTTDVYDKETKQGEGIINTLRLIFRPRQKLINHDTLRARSDTIKTNSWAGIMTYFIGIDPYRVQLFELRAKGTHGKLHFDFGKINEDVNNDNKENTEDGVTNLSLKNNQLEPEEDIGLDEKADVDEEGHGAGNPDPDGDDWYSQGQGKCPLTQCNDAPFSDPNSPIYYDYLNGTEGNINDLASGTQPDDEKLSRSGFNPLDAYFSYVVDLSNTDSTSKNSFYVSNSTRNGWKTFRIPIRDSAALDTVVSTESIKPDWGQVTHVRVWFEADTLQQIPDTAEIANWYFVQSNWQDSLVTKRVQKDSTQFVVASVSTDDGTFTPPPGVQAYQDKTNNVTEAQKGLGLVYKGILAGDTCLAIKRLPSVDRYSGYGSLEMYVHGDTTHSLSNSDSVMFFLRVGRDNNTFYEYHTLLAPGWDERNYVKMDFNEMTALKDKLLRALPKNSTSDAVDSTVGNYRIKGNPNINEVQWFAAGIVNLNPDKPASGQVWLDELRVTDVRRDVGTAARVEVMGNLADLGSYNVQWGQQNPYFRGISATTRGGSSDNLGSGASSNDYSWSLSLSMEKFLPRSLGAALPVAYSFSRTSRLPLLRAGTDIVLPEETRLAERALGITKTFRVSENFERKGRNPIFNWFLNRQQVSFSYSRNSNSDVNRPFYFGENYNVQGQFDMTVQKPPSVKFMQWTKSIPLLKRLRNTQLGLYPTSWRWAGTFNRNLSLTDDINFKRTSSFQRDFDGRVDLDYKVFDNLSAKFAASTRRDLSDPSGVRLKLKDWRLGQEMTFNQSFGLGYDPKLLSFLGTAFSYQTTYGDSWERTTGSLKSDLNRTWGVSGSFKHMELFSLGSKKTGEQAGGYDPTQGTVNRRTPYTARNAKKPKTQTKKKGSDRPFYDPPLAVLRFLTGWIQPVQYRYGEQYTSSLPGMIERPGASYRFGFSKNADVQTTREIRNPFASQGRNWDLSSSFSFLGGVSTQVSYKHTETQDVVRTGNLSKRASTVFPALTITIGKFKTLPLIKGPVNKFIDIFAPRTGFDREVAEEYDLTAGYLINRTETKDFNPLLGVNFKLFRALSLSASYQMNIQKGQRFNNSDGSLINDTRAKQRSITVTSRYSFRAPGGLTIPLFGKVKVTSTMNIELNVRKSLNTSETASSTPTGFGPFIKGENKSDMMIQPVISYDFSQQIKGGLTAQWQDTKDGSIKSHTRMLQIWAEIRF